MGSGPHAESATGPSADGARAATDASIASRATSCTGARSDRRLMALRTRRGTRSRDGSAVTEARVQLEGSDDARDRRPATSDLAARVS